MKPARVEFYLSTHPSHPSPARFSWRLKEPDGQIILNPEELFDSHRNAVASFRRVATALDARGPWQIVDEPGMPTRKSSHAMLTGKQQ